MLKIAITGNIASGKSQAEKILAEKYPVYDTDKIAHELLDEIKDFYGCDIFTEGKIDRKKLGALVFSNPNIKKQLEDIIHPKIRERLYEIFENHKNDEYVFISVPLLFEAGFETMFDKILIVTTDENTRLKRLKERDNLSEKEALERINSQMNEAEKILKSDFVIYNNSDLDHLKSQIDNILNLKITDC